MITGIMILIFSFICWVVYSVIDGLKLSHAENKWEIRILMYIFCIALKGYSLLYTYSLFSTFDLIVIIASIVTVPIFVFPFIQYLANGENIKHGFPYITKLTMFISGFILVLFQIYVILH